MPGKIFLAKERSICAARAVCKARRSFEGGYLDLDRLLGASLGF